MSFIDMIKETVTLVQKTDNIDIVKQLLEIQEQAMQLQEENKNLKEEIKTLKDNSSLQNKLIIKENMYYLKDEDIETGPYCTRCWDVDKKLVLMHSDNATNSEYMCPHDKCKVRTSMSYKEKSDFQEKILDMNNYPDTRF